jgi:predicted helicase
MACGTGKTLTSLRIAEAMVPKGGRILFLAPSISLVAQTLREWTAEASSSFHAFAICSDSKVGREQEDLKTHDLAYPATTNSTRLAEYSKTFSSKDPDHRTVVFSTYQSIQVVSDAQKQGFEEFDLIICDEAHRTTGITRDGDKASDFVKVHDNTVVAAKKRLYMTATPRIFADPSKQKAKDKDAELYSMDDESKYGSVFYRIGFGEAVRRGLLTDYRVLLVAVNEDKMPSFTNAYQAQLGDDKQAQAIDTQFVSKVMGTWKGLAKKDLRLVGDDGEEDASTIDSKPMQRAVSFARSIKASKTLKDNFPALVDLYQSHAHDDNFMSCEVRHVDGTQNALIRQQSLEWLRATDIDDNSCRILTNARCLSEGIDVPALDAVVFFDTRESIVDIVQSVGRVMRKAEGKEYGYIILPVGIPSTKLKDYNSYIEKDVQFKGIWKIIKALRAHDESLVDEAEFRKKITVIGGGDDEGGGGGEGGSGGGQIELGLPDLPIEDISEALYAAIPKKLGDREYWHDWAKDVARIAKNIMGRIRDLIQMPETRDVFDEFLKGVQDTINPAVDEEAAIEMLAQHQITRPVFEALFPDRSFVDENPVSRSMENVVEHLDRYRVNSETEELAAFYESIRERASLAKSEKSRQDLIKGLYESFFRTAFKDMADKLGIVYTPIEVVDFILQSAAHALKTHFGHHLTDENVHVLDPFTGTGTFITRLLQHPELIRDEDVKRKFEQELHANEIVLLAYYVATVNIESAFRARGNPEFLSFPGMVLTDTFQMTESDDLVDRVVLPENNARAERQNNLPIKVIIGNPPYSVTQGGAKYNDLDRRIGETYARYSLSTNKNSLYDSYIRAFRWATDRIGTEGDGVIAFVSNGGWIDGDATAGFRKCLQDDFSHIYVFNMRGNARTQGELRRQEGGGVFDAGSRTPVAVTILIRQAGHTGSGKIYYHDIGDYLSHKEKLAITEEFASIQQVPWQMIEPNESYDWINQRSDDFQKLKPLTGDNAIFEIRSRGVETSRDSWVYNFSKGGLQQQIQTTINFYNKQLALHHKALEKIPGGQAERVSAAKNLVSDDPRKIKWTSSLLQDFVQGKTASFDKKRIDKGVYRPFCKSWIYYDPQFNHRYKFRIFPRVESENLVIQVTGTGSTKDFSILVSRQVPDLEVISKGQCLPLYWYEKQEINVDKEDDLFPDNSDSDTNADEFIRHDGITDEALQEIQAHYRDQSITKEDVFYYVYGILHSPDYRQEYAADLKKDLPRIPYIEAFADFSQAGRDLAYWHLNYETIEPFPLTEHSAKMAFDEAEHYKVRKMKWSGSARKPDKSKIEFNDHLTLSGIPDEAHDYVVNGKSALEWILDRYQLTKDKDSGIVNDPNEWSDNPRYIVDLVAKVVRVSVETMKIVRSLPEL